MTARAAGGRGASVGGAAQVARPPHRLAQATTHRRRRRRRRTRRRRRLAAHPTFAARLAAGDVVLPSDASAGGRAC